jgi:hemerythrin superfamily protein
MQSDVGELPARGNDAIEILINDHNVVKSLLTQLTQARETTQRQSALEQLKAALTVHNATEENLVYPALDKVAGKKWESQRLYHESAEADVLIFELDTMLKEGDEGEFARRSEKLRDAILEHIDDEENSAFPHLRENADPRQAQMLTESVREFRSALRFAPSGRPSTQRGEVEPQRSTSTT